MGQYFPVTRATFESLLNRVAEETVKAELRRKVERLERLSKLHNWLVLRLLNAKADEG